MPSGMLHPTHVHHRLVVFFPSRGNARMMWLLEVPCSRGPENMTRCHDLLACFLQSVYSLHSVPPHQLLSGRPPPRGHDPDAGAAAQTSIVQKVTKNGGGCVATIAVLPDANVTHTCVAMYVLFKAAHRLGCSRRHCTALRDVVLSILLSRLDIVHDLPHAPCASCDVVGTL